MEGTADSIDSEKKAFRRHDIVVARPRRADLCAPPLASRVPSTQPELLIKKGEARPPGARGRGRQASAGQNERTWATEACSSSGPSRRSATARYVPSRSLAIVSACLRSCSPPMAFRQSAATRRTDSSTPGRVRASPTAEPATSPPTRRLGRGGDWDGLLTSRRSALARARRTPRLTASALRAVPAARR